MTGISNGTGRATSKRPSRPEGREENALAFMSLGEELNALRYRAKWLAASLAPGDQLDARQYLVGDALGGIESACEALFDLAVAIRAGEVGVIEPDNPPAAPLLDAIDTKAIEEALAEAEKAREQLELATFAREGAEAEVAHLKAEVAGMAKRCDEAHAELREARAQLDAVKAAPGPTEDLIDGGSITSDEPALPPASDYVVKCNECGWERKASESRPCPKRHTGGFSYVGPIPVPTEDDKSIYWDVVSYGLVRDRDPSPWVARVAAKSAPEALEHAFGLIGNPVAPVWFEVARAKDDDFDSAVEQSGGIKPHTYAIMTKRGADYVHVRAAIARDAKEAIKPHPAAADPPPAAKPDWRTTPIDGLTGVGLAPMAIDLLEDVEKLDAGSAWDWLMGDWDDCEKDVMGRPALKAIAEALVKLRAEAGDPATPDEVEHLPLGIDVGLDLRPETEGDDAPDPDGEPVVTRDPLTTDELLEFALNKRQGMAGRWEAMAAEGATDAEVRAAIQRAFDDPIANGQLIVDGGHCRFVGTPAPKFWVADRVGAFAPRPTLESTRLVERARLLLAIPLEDGSHPPAKKAPSRKRKGVAS